MANRNFTLVRLCKTEKGWRRYPAVIGKNGRVKPGFVRVGAKEKEFKEGRYTSRCMSAVLPAALQSTVCASLE